MSPGQSWARPSPKQLDRQTGLAVALPGAGPARWGGQRGSGWGRHVEGRLPLGLQTSGKEEGSPWGTGAREPGEECWGCSRKSGGGGSSREGEGVPIRDIHQPVDRVEGGCR